MSNKTGVKYPQVKVQLTGGDGNGFIIVAKVRRAMKAALIAPAEIDAFTNEATSGDYDHLLQTCMAWVTVK